MNTRIVSVLVVFSLLACIVCLANVSGFGVSSAFYKDNPLYVVPGQIFDLDLELQNMVGNEDLTLKAEVVEGSEIAKIADAKEEYFVPFGSKEVQLKIRITIPEDASPGKQYSIIVSFTTVTKGETGAVATGSSIEKYIPVIVQAPASEVGEGEEEEGGLPTVTVIAIIVGIIVVILIIWAIVKKKRGASQFNQTQGIHSSTTVTKVKQK